MQTIDCKTYDTIVIDKNTTIQLLSISKRSIAIGVSAPKELTITRSEAKRKEPQHGTKR